MTITQLIQELDEWCKQTGDIEVRIEDTLNQFDAPIYDVQFETYGNDNQDHLSIRI